MEEKKKPEKVIRSGAVAASIWSRKGNRGLYWEFTISRCFKQPDSEKFCYSSSFRERDAQAVAQCMDEACSWIRDQYDVRPKSPETASQQVQEQETAHHEAVKPTYAAR